MSLPREYLGWQIDINADWPGPEHWEAFHRDHEGTTLRAATEKDLMVEIDCWEACAEPILKTFSVEFGNPRKEVQICYQVQARDFADATVKGKRLAQLNRTPQKFHAVYEVRA